MMIFYSERFWKMASRLSTAQQKKLAAQMMLLQSNPFDPRLHTKYLEQPLSGFLSFRITRDWRVQFRFLDADTILCAMVKHRKDIYR